MGLFNVQEICARTKALGLGGKVTVSHGFCLGGITERKAAEAAQTMAEAGVALVTHGAGGLTMPPIEMLRGAGVLVFAGNDDIRDTWSPYGTGDLLERAAIIGWKGDFRRDGQVEVAFDLISAAGAQALGIADYGVAVGAAANQARFLPPDARARTREVTRAVSRGRHTANRCAHGVKPRLGLMPPRRLLPIEPFNARRRCRRSARPQTARIKHAGIICTGETYKNVVKLTFAKGASLEDPSGLFNYNLEGGLFRAYARRTHTLSLQTNASPFWKALQFVLDPIVDRNRICRPASGTAQAAGRRSLRGDRRNVE
jgi:hypothetical protein